MLILESKTMPIQVSWDNPEQTIIRADFSPGWNLADFRAAIDIIHRWSDEAHNSSFRGVIVDLTQEKYPPVGAMPHFKHSIMDLGGVPRPVVFVNVDPVTQRLFDIAKRLYHISRPLYYVKSLDEARQRLLEGELIR
jgi:hypothetical protein